MKIKHLKAIGCIAVGMYILFLMVYSQPWKLNVDESVKVVGKVTEIEYFTHTSSVLSVDYNSESGEKYTFHGDRKLELSPFEKGDEVAIVYSKADPTKAMYASNPGFTYLIFFCCSIAIGFVAVGFSILFLDVFAYELMSRAILCLVLGANFTIIGISLINHNYNFLSISEFAIGTPLESEFAKCHHNQDKNCYAHVYQFSTLQNEIMTGQTGYSFAEPNLRSKEVDLLYLKDNPTFIECYYPLEFVWMPSLVALLGISVFIAGLFFLRKLGSS